MIAVLEHESLKKAAAWLGEIATFLTLVKPPLLIIAESVVFLFGLASIVWLLLGRGH